MLLSKNDFPKKEKNDAMTATKSLDTALRAHQRYLIKSENEDLDEAINYYIESIKQNPKIASAYYHLATLLYNSGQIELESAIEQCSKAVWLDADDANAHMYLGYFLSLKEDYEQAKIEFESALKLNPKKSRTRIALALTLIEKIKTSEKKPPKDCLKALYYGFTGGILSVFDKASLKMLFENISGDINFLKNRILGEFYEKINSEKKAYNIYLKIADNSKKSIRLWEKMANIAISKNRYDAAFDCLNNAVILSNNDPIKIVNAIEFTEKYQMNRIDELIDYYTLLINKFPELSKCYFELGHLYLKKGEKINALSAFQMALKYDDENPYYQNSLAFAYIQLEQYEPAIELYKKALEKNPDDEWSAVVAQALAALYYQVENNPEAAISTLENALLLTKNKSQIYAAMADIYYDAQDLDMASEYYEKALDDDFKNPKLYSRLAMTCWEQDYIERSIMYYTKALELDSSYDIAYNNLGVVFLDGLGDIERAQTHFKTAIEINPDYVLAHFNLGRSLEAQGEKIRAAKAYQKALNLNKEKQEFSEEIIQERLHKLFET